MRPIRDKWLIQIEVTNACPNRCANCSRLVAHQRQPYFMSLEEIEAALDSLDGFPGGIGIMGGEPLLHPHFRDICTLLRRKVPPEKRWLWTTGHNWDKYKTVIRKTFCGTFFNDHRDRTQKHHPMLLGVADVTEDSSLVEALIEDCWVDRRWSASINPKGCFFCEVAAAFDLLFDGPGGLPVEPGWWRQDPAAFTEQRNRACYRCGAPVPFPPLRIAQGHDLASATNYQALKTLQTPCFSAGAVRLFSGKLSQEALAEAARDWQPWSHWGDAGPAKDHNELSNPDRGPLGRIKHRLEQRYPWLGPAGNTCRRWLWSLHFDT